METKQIDHKKSKNNYFNWLLWWKISPEELSEQIEGYNTLKITKSARGISLLLIVLSFLITLAFVLFLGWDSAAMIDSVLLLVLGIFIYKGHKWAMIGAIVLWTIEKISIFLMGASSNLLTAIIWWAIYMHPFYLAFQVEKQRKLKPATAVSTNTEITQ